jgi:hypothetical protein
MAVQEHRATPTRDDRCQLAGTSRLLAIDAAPLRGTPLNHDWDAGPVSSDSAQRRDFHRIDVCKFMRGA